MKDVSSEMSCRHAASPTRRPTIPIAASTFLGLASLPATASAAIISGTQFFSTDYWIYASVDVNRDGILDVAYTYSLTGTGKQVSHFDRLAGIPSAGTTVTRTSLGAQVSATLPYYEVITNLPLPVGGFLRNGYQGIRFASTDVENYGWIHFYTVNNQWRADYGYETTPGLPIQAGAVPEPNSTLMLLATGAAGLGLRRARHGRP